MIKVLTKAELVTKPFENPRPHVVILGAGASYSAMPMGDKYKNKIPLMNELQDVLDNPMRKYIKDAEPSDGSFEEKFSWLRKTEKAGKQLYEIEKQIENYFSKLELPETATTYDYLVLGLRQHDVIATFNWDPFLLQAYKRNQGICELPDIRFLHGCVHFYSCLDHDALGGPSEICPCCKQMLTKSNLIFPDDKKDYEKDPIIKRDWDAVETKLQQAFHLTIFGYSGPETDYRAKNILNNSWSQTPINDFSHVEIIDKKDRNTLYENWIKFLPHFHIQTFDKFLESSIAKWPRRTFEWKYAASSKGKPAEQIGPCKTESLHELQEFIKEIASSEE